MATLADLTATISFADVTTALLAVAGAILGVHVTAKGIGLMMQAVKRG